MRCCRGERCAGPTPEACAVDHPRVVAARAPRNARRGVRRIREATRWNTGGGEHRTATRCPHTHARQGVPARTTRKLGSGGKYSRCTSTQAPHLQLRERAGTTTPRTWTKRSRWRERTRNEGSESSGRGNGAVVGSTILGSPTGWIGRTDPPRTARHDDVTGERVVAGGQRDATVGGRRLPARARRHGTGGPIAVTRRGKGVTRSGGRVNRGTTGRPSSG